MGALTIGFMGNSEQASISNTVLANNAVNNTGGSVACTIQNTGSSSVTINSGTVDGTSWTLAAPVTIAKGSSGTVTLTTSSGTPFANTAQYTIKLMTAKGNTITTQAQYTGS